MPMRIVFGILVLFLVVPLAWAQSAKEMAAVIGSWEGDSKCTVPDSPCHDEHVLLQVSADKKQPDQLNLDAYKIIEGSPQFMGTLACEYRSKQAALSCTANTSQHDHWDFHLSGQVMSGKLTLEGGKILYRRISLRKSLTSD